MTLPNVNYRMETVSEESLLSEKEHQVLKYISTRQSASRAEVAAEARLSQSAAIRTLNRLLELGLIQKNGNGKNTKYFYANSGSELNCR